MPPPLQLASSSRRNAANSADDATPRGTGAAPWTRRTRASDAANPSLLRVMNNSSTYTTRKPPPANAQVRVRRRIPGQARSSGKIREAARRERRHEAAATQHYARTTCVLARSALLLQWPRARLRPLRRRRAVGRRGGGGRRHRRRRRAAAAPSTRRRARRLRRARRARARTRTTAPSGKNRAAGGAAGLAPPPKPRAVAAAPSAAAGGGIPSYSMVDDGALCKVLIPFAGAGALAAGALTVDFRDRSFDLRAVADGKVWRLHVPLLHEEINQHECGCRVRPGKLIVRLAKRDGSKGWYELRKTKGVGDTEWHKLVPDAGERRRHDLTPRRLRIDSAALEIPCRRRPRRSRPTTASAAAACATSARTRPGSRRRAARGPVSAAASTYQ